MNTSTGNRRWGIISPADPRLFRYVYRPQQYGHVWVRVNATIWLERHRIWLGFHGVFYLNGLEYITEFSERPDMLI